MYKLILVIHCFRYEHAFELSTTKSGGRVYLFAADLLKDKTKWMNKIAKVWKDIDCIIVLNSKLQIY